MRIALALSSYHCPKYTGDGLPQAIVVAVLGDEHARALRDHRGEPGVAKGLRQVLSEVGKDCAKTSLRVADLPTMNFMLIVICSCMYSRRRGDSYGVMLA